jgi:hypothetical protein
LFSEAGAKGAIGIVDPAHPYAITTSFGSRLPLLATALSSKGCPAALAGRLSPRKRRFETFRVLVMRQATPYGVGRYSLSQTEARLAMNNYSFGVERG